MSTSLPASRVAILVDFLYDYQAQIRRGLRAALDEAGLTSVTFVGRHLRPDNPGHRKANELYALLDPARFHGLLVSAASMGRSAGEEALREFVRSYPLPAVTMSRKLHGVPAVVVDNERGLRELMAHLVHQRGFTKFVYVGGTSGNHEAELRERVVRGYLGAHGLELPPQRVLQGDFYGPRAAQELTRLLTHDRDFEVVVCANDEMALEVMEVLARHELNVPADVAVVGFDDVAEASSVEPPLTTVGQPTVELGAAAVNLLQRLMAGLDVPQEVALPSRLKLRKSCGAFPEWFTPPRTPVDRELLAAFTRALHDPAAAPAFLARWRQAVRSLNSDEGSIAAVRMALQAHADTLGAGEDVRERLTPLLLMTLDTVGMRQVGHSTVRQALARNNEVSAQLELSLSAHEHFESFALDVREYMRSLDVQRYALVLYERFGPQPAGTARLLSTPYGDPAALGSFPTRELLPPALQHELDRGHHLLVPLYSRDLHFGLLLFEEPDIEHFSVEQVRNTLSAGLHQLHATQRHRHHTEELERQVRERTRALENEVAVRLQAESALRALNQALSLSASTDALTGIPNRAAFDAQLEREWGTHRLSGRPLSVLLCDVDCFKQYNDHYGHLQGDECLRRVAQTIHASGRNRGDFTARYGGEEFVMVLPDTDEVGAELVAQRLLASVRALDLPHAASPVAPHVTISVGIATLSPDLRSLQELLRLADGALYQSKQRGRDRHCVAGPASD